MSPPVLPWVETSSAASTWADCLSVCLSVCQHDRCDRQSDRQSVSIRQQLYQQRTGHSHKTLKCCTVWLQGVLYSHNVIRLPRTGTCGLPSAHLHQTRNVQTSCTNFHAPPTINMPTTVTTTFILYGNFHETHSDSIHCCYPVCRIL